jgi:hypoxanthine phosphoribosyltransferase
MTKPFSIKNVFILLLILLIHYVILNGIEKIFFSQLSFIDNTIFLRPSSICSKLTDEYITGCLGLPSGHAEIITIIAYILYKSKYISLYVSCFLVFLVGLQRFYTHKHSIIQIAIGILFGLFYGFLYFKTGLSLKSLALQLFFICISTVLILFIIDGKINQYEIPSWVDSTLHLSIKEKQNANIFIKLYSITAPAYEQSRFLFIDWELLEKKLDNIVTDIKSTNIHYDAVVGIKTGGAIISGYISNKLGIPNYNIKVSTSENKCNKTTARSMQTYYDMYYKKEKKEYVMCEKISDDLSNKKIILIDESVASGGTMQKSIDYLLDEKNISKLYACCIYKNKHLEYRDIEIHSQNQTNNICLIWPWGYDN